MGSSLDLVTGRVQVGTRGLRGLSRPRLGPEPVSPSFVQGSWSGVWELCLAGNHWLAVLGKLRALPDLTSQAIALHPPVPWNVITGHPGFTAPQGSAMDLGSLPRLSEGFSRLPAGCLLPGGSGRGREASPSGLRGMRGQG